jgi:hypothetical protein
MMNGLEKAKRRVQPLSKDKWPERHPSEIKKLLCSEIDLPGFSEEGF